LERRVKAELAFLNKPDVNFFIACDEAQISRTGIDDVEFLISANAGEPPKPIAKIASGGELARIMLSFKNVISARDFVDTMIFDEVDSGISGSAADKVGRKLKEISRTRQVICATHLAQVGAYADCHLLISKSVREGRTFTDVKALDHDGRGAELARLGSGGEITETARQNAAELLRLAGSGN